MYRKATWQYDSPTSKYDVILQVEAKSEAYRYRTGLEAPTQSLFEEQHRLSNTKHALVA